MQGVVLEELRQTIHTSTINSFCYNERFDRFATTDEKSIKLWCRDGDIRTVNLPPRTSYLIQTIEYLGTRDLYVASCLDGTLRFYDDHLNELASVFTHRATILCIVFDEPRQRIITGGIDGCGAWVLRGKDWDGYEHEGPSMRNPMYQVAPLEAFSKTGTTWVQRVKLDADHAMFLSNNSIFVYTLHDNVHTETYKKIVKPSNGAITDFIIYKQKLIVASCMDGAIYVVTIYPRSTLAIFKDHTKTVTSLAYDEVSQSVFSTSLDGSIRMWDLDLLRNIHQIRLEAPISGLLLVPKTNPLILACQTRQAMHLLMLKYTLKEHSTTASPVAILARMLAPGKKPRKKATKIAQPSTLRRKVSQIPIHLMLEKIKEPTTPIIDDDELNDNHIITMCQDRSVRVYASRRNATPSATWIPDESIVQEVIGFAYNPYCDMLYLLLKKSIQVYDTQEDMTTPLRIISIDNRIVKSICALLSPPQYQLSSRRSVNRRCGMDTAVKSRVDYQSQSLLEDELGVNWIVCGTDKGELLFCSSFNATLEEAMLQVAHAACVTYLSYTSIASATLVSFAQDKTLAIWKTSPRMTRIAIMTLGEIPTCMNVAPTSQLMVCGFEDGRVDFIDFAYTEPKLITSEVNHSSLVIAADFSDELHLCVTTSFDMSIKVWDQTKNLLREVQMSAPLSCLCFANDKGDLFVGIIEKLFVLFAADVLPSKMPTKRIVELVPSTPEATVIIAQVTNIILNDQEENNNTEQTAQVDTNSISTELPHHSSKHRRAVQVLQNEFTTSIPPVLRPTRPETQMISSPRHEAMESRMDESFEGLKLLPLLQEAHYDMRQVPLKPLKTSERTEEVNAIMSPIIPAFNQSHPPIVQRTPRKLWNAIGAEDRRLIVLQRKPTQQ
ncbi:hypothetical protein THRCLA_01989 [Thraustotheca clavata]|uniref:Uncharacterized protein n=1 Tax=Thraustotheca clavata TaxID=74557 RepID=A0A1W0A6L3_9STRA|nr:hypothetical protein THRCLA_01989 [Thraustotheca clavata]